MRSSLILRSSLRRPPIRCAYHTTTDALGQSLPTEVSLIPLLRQQVRRSSTSNETFQPQQTSLTGMSFASTQRSNNSSLVQLDSHVTAWYRPEPFDMTMVYNTIQQLAYLQNRRAAAAAHTTIVGSQVASSHPHIKLSCSFPTLPSTYMNGQRFDSSTVPTFATSPLLSHVEFLCVTVPVPLAHLFSGGVDDPLPNFNLAPDSSSEPGRAIPQRSTLSLTIPISSRKRSKESPQSQQPTSSTAGLSSHQSSQSSSKNNNFQTVNIPLTSFAGTPAPLGSDPMTFIIFQEGTIVGWNAPWSEMVSLRNLLAIRPEDVSAEVGRLERAFLKNVKKREAAAERGGSAALSSPLVIDPQSPTVGGALWSLLRKATIDPTHGVVGSVVEHYNIASNNAYHAYYNNGPSASTPAYYSTNATFTSSSKETAATGNSSSPANDPSSSSSSTTNIASQQPFQRVSALTVCRTQVWSFVSSFTSIFTPNSLFSFLGIGGTAGSHHHRVGKSNYLQDKFGAALSAPFISASSLPVTTGAISGIDTMRFNFFDRYPNAQGAAADRREQLEESGDFVPSAEYHTAPMTPLDSISTVVASSSRPPSQSVGSQSTSLSPIADFAVAEEVTPSIRTPVSMRNFVDADKDFIVLSDTRDHYKVPFSYALAQSVKLDALDHAVAPIAGTVKSWQQSMAATGKLACDVKGLRRTKTRLLTLVEALNFKNNVQTTPKVFWSGELQFVRNAYKDACEHLEIEDRRELLQTKMDTVDESLTYLHDEVHANTMEFLTWVIIILIAMEISVAFGLLHLLSQVAIWIGLL